MNFEDKQNRDLATWTGTLDTTDELKVLKPKHKLIVLMHLEGNDTSDIVDQTGASPSTVYSVLKSGLAKAIMEDYYAFCGQEFKNLYSLAIAAVRDALKSDDIEVRLKAADKFFKAHNMSGGPGSKAVGGGGETAEDVIKRIFEMKLKVTEVRPA